MINMEIASGDKVRESPSLHMNQVIKIHIFFTDEQQLFVLVVRLTVRIESEFESQAVSPGSRTPDPVDR